MTSTTQEYWKHPILEAIGQTPRNVEDWRIGKQTEDGKVIYLAFAQKGGFAVGNKKWANKIIKNHGNIL